MNGKPHLSVIMPTYNGEEYLEAALDSILAQGPSNIKHIEILVVDDGSTDQTLTIIESYKSKLPIRLVSSRRIGNWLAGTNEGLQAASGEFVTILHQDDGWADKRLKIVFQLMNEFKHIDIFVHNTTYVDNYGRRLCAWKCPFGESIQEINPGVFFKKLIVQDFISIDAPVFKRSLVDEIGLFDENFWYTADWDYWLKLFSSRRSLFINQELVFFRIHADAQTIKGSKKQDDFKLQLRQIFNRHASRLNPNNPSDLRRIKAGIFSNTVNMALATSLHNKSFKPILKIIRLGVKLSPTTFAVYLRYSRIHERVFARIRAYRSTLFFKF